MNKRCRAAIPVIAALFSLTLNLCFPLPCFFSVCSAEAILDWEELVWPLQVAPPEAVLSRWLALPDSLIGKANARLIYQPLYYRWPGDGDKSFMRYVSPQSSALLRFRRKAWVVGLDIAGGSNSITADFPTVPPQKTRVSLGSTEGELSALIARQLPISAKSLWVVGAGLGSVQHLGSPWWVGSAISLGPDWCISYEHGTEFQYARLDYYYENEFIELPFSYGTIGDRCHLLGTIIPSLKFEVQLASYALTDAQANVPTAEKAFSPAGGFSVQKYQLGLKTKGYGTFTFTHRQDYLNSQAYFYDDGVIFGKVTRGDFFISSFDAGWKRSIGKRSRFSILFRYLYLSGYLKGHMEFWPFTPTFIDLLGMRRYYDGFIEAKAASIHSLWEYSQNKNWSHRIGLSCWYVVPAGQFDHWQPLFLVFGKTDERSTVLQVTEAWIGGFTFGTDFRSGRWKAAFSLGQLFPIYVRKVPSPEGVPQPPLEAPRARVYGGGFFRFSVTWFF